MIIIENTEKVFSLKYSFLRILFIPLILLFTAASFAIPVDIQDISDDKYFRAVHEKLSAAKDSIYMAMYEISIEPDKTESAGIQLYDRQGLSPKGG